MSLTTLQTFDSSYYISPLIKYITLFLTTLQGRLQQTTLITLQDYSHQITLQRDQYITFYIDSTL